MGWLKGECFVVLRRVSDKVCPHGNWTGRLGEGGGGRASSIEAQLKGAKIACDSKGKGRRSSDGPLAANQQQAAKVLLR